MNNWGGKTSGIHLEMVIWRGWGVLVVEVRVGGVDVRANIISQPFICAVSPLGPDKQILEPPRS